MQGGEESLTVCGLALRIFEASLFIDFGVEVRGCETFHFLLGVFGV